MIRAVLFDYYFTLAMPAGADFPALASAAGSSLDSASVMARRRLALANRPPPPTPIFDGPVPTFRRYYEEWEDHGAEFMAACELDPAEGWRYAAERRRAHAMAETAPDAVRLLQALRQQGYLLGVVSDADCDWLAESVEYLGFELDVVVCSEDAACYKPHRRMFDATLGQLGVRADEAIFVGDTPLADIEGARRAGLFPIWLNSRHLDWPADLPSPPAQIGSLLEFPATLARMAGG